MTDIYAFWRACQGKGDIDARDIEQLALPTIAAPITRENPQCGLWKVRLKKGEPFVLMQIWLADEAGKPASAWGPGLKLLNLTAGKELPLLELAERWLFAGAATKEEAAFWRANGRWPADPPPLPPRSHNQPTDPYELLKTEADDRLEQVKIWINENSPIGDQVACDTARNMQAELLDVGKRADAMFETEKEPNRREGRRIDAKYRFRETLEQWSVTLREAFEGFMRAEERRRNEEAARKHREDLAKAEAERARIEAERAQKMRDDPVAAHTDPEPVPPPLPLLPQPVKVQAGGGVGRKAGLKDDWDIEFLDVKLAAAHVASQPDVAIVVGKAVKRLVKAAKGQVEIPGVKITTVRRAA